MHGCSCNDMAKHGLNDEHIIVQIVLCATNKEQTVSIISHWAWIYTILNDIIDVLLIFAKSFTVYSTTKEITSGHPPSMIASIPSWQEV